MYVTFKRHDDGSFHPVQVVYMTDAELAAYEEYKEQLVLREEVLDILKQEPDPEPAAAPKKMRKSRGHQSHARPKPGVYKHGNSYLSEERIRTVIDTYEASNKDVGLAASMLNITTTTLYTYLSVAKREGLLT